MDIVKAAAFGVVIGHNIKAAIIVANISTAAQFSSGGTEIAEAQLKIHAIYAYNHAHNDASIKGMMKEIATADKQRDRAEISGTNGGIANMVTERQQHMVMEVGQETSYSEEESAMAATSESDSSVEKKSSRRGRERKSGRRSYRKAAAPSNSSSPSFSTRGPYVERTRSTSRASNKLKPHEVNPTNCKWCKKYGGNGLAHGTPNKIPHARCNYNEDRDGWRPDYVYKRMNILYKERSGCEE